jgi:hypothetical protein
LAVQPNRNEEEDNESYEDKQEAIFGLAESTTGNEQGEQIRRTITMVCTCSVLQRRLETLFSHNPVVSFYESKHK